MTSRTATPPALVQGRTIDELLVPLTFSASDDRILALTWRLAKRWGIRLRLVNVSDLVDANDPKLDAIASELSQQHPEIETTTTHVYGHDVGTGIASVAGAHSLIVMATEHANEWKQKGSVAEKVLFSAGVPVLIFGPDARHFDPNGEIVIGLDGSASSEAALGAAVALADTFETMIWLVQIVPVLDSNSTIDTDIADYIQDQAQMLNREPVGWEIIHSNDPVTALRGFAAARGAGVIVAGARGRTDPHKQRIGSITMGLVATADSPVLAIAVPPEP